MISIFGDIKDRAIRLVDYLLELTRFHSTIVRDIKDYQNVLWIHEIPQESDTCFTQAWGANKEFDSDVWIEIKKYDEPILDEVPDVCQIWANQSTLYNTEEIPELYSEINIQTEEENTDASSDSIDQDQVAVITKTLKIEDHPEVSEAWDQFIESNWFPWRDLHLKWQSVQKVYSKLFAIHQEQQKSGEEYELILGIGFLTWNTPSNQATRRHLITAKAALNFEAKLGKFTLNPAVDGAQLDVELDMLDIEEQPINARQTTKEELISAEDNPWDRSSIDPVLTALANLISDQGHGAYHKNNLVPSHHTDKSKPIIDYSPALILRKRSLRGLEMTLHEMRKQIDEGVDIPPEFMDLCEAKVDKKDMDKKLSSETDQTIFFPKPSNEEQRQIIQKLLSTSGVLVQGPPGTGKSHTIANLICHLLATGKRVLVTAKTPRALQVLEKLIPQQLRPLCINLLGSGIDEQRSLEASVGSILAEQDKWNEDSVNSRISKLGNSIHQLKSNKSEIDYRIRSIREAETSEHSIINATYRGTAAMIAMKLQKESASFNWFRDKISYDHNMPLSQDDIMNLHTELTKLTPELDAELKLIIPDPEKDIPSLIELEELFCRYSEAKTQFLSGESLLNSQIGETLKCVDLQDIHDIIDNISRLAIAVERIRKRPMPWIKTAIYDMLTDNDTPWKDLLQIILENLQGLKERAQKIDTQSLSIPPDVDYNKLLQDAKILKQHFDEGGKNGWWFFKPKVIREHRYLIEDVKVDACPCNSSQILEMLIEHISIRQTVDYCWSIWENKAARKSGPIFLQIAELEELQEALTSVVQLFGILKNAKLSLQCVKGFAEPAWYDLEAVNKLLDTCKAVISKSDFEKVQEQLSQIVTKMETLANSTNMHLITNKILSAIVKMSAKDIRSTINRICELRELSERARWTRSTIERLAKSAPILAKELSDNPKDNNWIVRLKKIDKAWTWARANSWLHDFLKEDDLPSLERRSRQIDEEIMTCLAELSAARAWRFCFMRMDDSHRRHLMGWQQAIKKIGKGTGRHAPKHRRTAQEHLNKCREAVPSWVMPLHRVYESVKPAPGIFDVIIVDEASQCGPESLPLTFLSKRLIVVGDEQQISPEAVGINRDQVQHLMDEYLKDFEHADSFDVESSLFDHAKRRFGNRIVLREHFRCVPEIIRFSNDLSYHATPLIPLRQYPPQRLEPLKLVHVPKGYREGEHSKAINRPEAEALVDAVIQCCNDDLYDDKTMGIIILQGNAQAALIENMLLEQLGAEEIEQRRLICGNPYSFQGDERDIIFLSMVAAPNKRIGPYARPADQRRFNVAASRARDQMWLFHTATLNDLSESCLRRRLLEHFINPTSQITKSLGEEAEKLRELAHTANRMIEKPPSPYDSWFEVDVALEIASRGYRVIPQYPIAGRRIDLVIEGSKSQLAVECYGDHWHGADQYEKDMYRQRMLERCGWRFYIVRECEFNANPQKALDTLWQELSHLGIHPISETTSSTDTREDENYHYGSVKSETEEHQGQLTLFDIRTSKQQHQKTKRQRINQDAKSINYSNPSDIQDALSMKPSHLRRIIIDMLKNRPNYSCVKDALPGLVLKELKIISRGKPREAFSRKVNQSLTYLKRESIIEIYKSKNLRIKLIKPDY